MYVVIFFWPVLLLLVCLLFHCWWNIYFHTSCKHNILDIKIYGIFLHFPSFFLYNVCYKNGWHCLHETLYSKLNTNILCWRCLFVFIYLTRQVCMCSYLCCNIANKIPIGMCFGEWIKRIFSYWWWTKISTYKICKKRKESKERNVKEIWVFFCKKKSYIHHNKSLIQMY